MALTGQELENEVNSILNANDVQRQMIIDPSNGNLTLDHTPTPTPKLEI